jgi:hypothetical protein
MMSGKEVSSGKNGTLREKKKYERFMGIQVKKVAMARNMMAIEAEKLRIDI